MRADVPAYRAYGEAPVKAIVLHGGPGAPGCAAGLCRCSRHGVIEHLQKGRSIDELCAELQTIFLEQDMEKTALIGHSFGAWLAVLFACRYPQRVSRLILIGCPPMEREYAAQIDNTRAERRQAGIADTDNHCALPGSSGDMLYFDSEQHIALMAEINALRDSGDLLAAARSIRSPVAALHGAFDPHPVEAVCSAFEGHAQGFAITVLERCGHDPWKEQYARDAFCAWLNSEIVQTGV